MKSGQIAPLKMWVRSAVSVSGSSGTPAAMAPLMATLRTLPGHVFWPNDISLVDTKYIDALRLLSASQVTDSYLLALASAHGGQLASFDRRLVTDAVRGRKRCLHLIE